MSNLTKMDRVLVAIGASLVLFLLAMCSSLGDKTVDFELRRQCEKFCDVRNHDVKLAQDDVCICK